MDSDMPITITLPHSTWEAIGRQTISLRNFLASEDLNAKSTHDEELVEFLNILRENKVEIKLYVDDVHGVMGTAFEEDLPES